MSSSPPLPIPPPRDLESNSPSSFKSRSSRGGSDSSSLKNGAKDRDSSRENHRSYFNRQESRDLIHQLKEQLMMERNLFEEMKSRVEMSERRAVDAEKRSNELAGHLRTVNEARIVALRDVARTSEELKLYKIQLEAAQKEIFRAQDVLGVVDSQRHHAEQDAAKGRSVIRKLNEERMIQMAREEGRRLGLQEGLSRGREMRLEAERPMEFNRESISEASATSSAEQSSTEIIHATRPPSTVDFGLRNFQTSSIPEVERFRTSPTPTRPSPPPIPIPSPVREEAPQMIPPPPMTRPASVRTVSPQTIHLVIPPDNFIPEIDADNRIRIPPPHEFHRPPSAYPDTPLSPSQTSTRENEEPIMVPHHNTDTSQRYQRSRRRSSPDSASTGFSQFDLVHEPQHMPTPMSVIQEVNSAQTSPNPQSLQGDQLRHRPSLSGQSSHQALNLPTPRPTGVDLGQQHYQGEMYTRPRSMMSDSIQPERSSSQRKQRKSVSSTGTLPDINIQAPSGPPSTGSTQTLREAETRLSPRPQATALPKNFTNVEPTGSYNPGTSAAGPSYQNTGGMPGYMDMSTFSGGSDEAPVIPDPQLIGTESEDDAMSSGIESSNTLTTPPTRYIRANQSDWSGALQMATQVPIPPSTVAGTPRTGWGSVSGRYSNGNRTPAVERQRPLSRSTNRTRDD